MCSLSFSGGLGEDGDAGGSTPYGYNDASVGDGRDTRQGCVTTRSPHSKSLNTYFTNLSMIKLIKEGPQCYLKFVLPF